MVHGWSARQLKIEVRAAEDTAAISLNIQINKG